jgi:hypothetical protein
VGTREQLIEFTLVRIDYLASNSIFFFTAGESVPPSDFGTDYSWADTFTSQANFAPIPISTIPLNLTEATESFDEVDFVAHGMDDVVIDASEENIAVSLDQAEPVSTLLPTVSPAHNIPCKEEPHEKFAFTISDIHEIGRRYIRMVPVNNVALDQFVVATRSGGDGVDITNINIGVQPQHIFRGLFAAWAGSIKYRIYTERAGSLPQVTFVPFLNPSGREPGIPIIDAMNSHSFVDINTNTAITSNTAITGSIAREVQYPITQDVSYIDVSCPFQSHFNFCYNSKTGPVTPVSSGTLAISSADSQAPDRIFTAFGDDLRLGVYRPPRTTTFNLSVFRNGIAGFYAS